MPLERVELSIKPGLEQEFLGVMHERGLPLLRSVPGVNSAAIGRGVEAPEKFLLLVEWDRMDSHDAFETLTVYPEFRGLFTPYITAGAMEHFEMRS